MGSRRKGREAAIKILYSVDITTEAEYDGLILAYFKENPEDADTRQFSTDLVIGVLENREAIDSSLVGALDNWELDRLGYMERAILRLGYYEISLSLDIPEIVAINEAIELAKLYCEPDFAKLVNAALDRLRKEGGAASETVNNDGGKIAP